jgi:hypothetical protein
MRRASPGVKASMATRIGESTPPRTAGSWNSGQDLAVMDATDARALTDCIKVGVEAIWELVTQAYTLRAWSSLGYQSWDDYCTREFGATRLRLPREERTEVVASLRESGLSIRAIAAATGVDKNTVQSDLAQVSEIHNLTSR